MNVNGGRPACLYNDPSVFVKTEFDTGKLDFIKSDLSFKKSD